MSASADSIAYINFTSGSTGEPKGVVWNHRSELFGIRAKTNALQIGAEDRVSLLRSHNVGATRDTYLALLNGATLVTANLHEQSLASLAQWLAREEITVFSCVATIFRQAVQSARGAGDFAKIRLVHIGGEPIFKSDIALYRQYFPDRCSFVSRYSISETQAVAYFFIDKQTNLPMSGCPSDTRSPAARSLSATMTVMSWARLKPEKSRFAVAISHGDTGSSPSLPARSFLPMAKTAMFAPISPAISATDCQTAVSCLSAAKIFKRRSAAIAWSLRRWRRRSMKLLEVKQAAVVRRRDEAGRDRLIAYVVRKAAAMLTVKQLRAELSMQLPSYMMPTAFVFLQKLPVNSAGKIDRRALPAPQADHRPINEPAVAARTAVEKILLNIWRDALKIDSLGIHDDFTELGGDSLLGAEIAARSTILLRLRRRSAACIKPRPLRAWRNG